MPQENAGIETPGEKTVSGSLTKGGQVIEEGVGSKRGRESWEGQVIERGRERIKAPEDKSGSALSKKDRKFRKFGNIKTQ